MYNYSLCNLLSENVFEAGNVKLPHVFVDSEESVIQDCKAVMKKDGLHFTDTLEDGCEPFDMLGNLSAKKPDELVENLVPTEDNPIIFVITDSVKLGHNTYIKYFCTKTAIVIALIRGYMEVRTSDGEYIPLARNFASASSSSLTEFSVHDLWDYNCLEQEGIYYRNYVIADCNITIQVCNDGRVLKSMKADRNNFVFLNKELFDKKVADARAKALYKKAALEERHLRNKALQDNYAQVVKQREEAKAADAEKKATRKPRSKSAVVPVAGKEFKGSSNTANPFAAAFLDAVRGANK